MNKSYLNFDFSDGVFRLRCRHDTDDIVKICFDIHLPIVEGIETCVGHADSAKAQFFFWNDRTSLVCNSVKDYQRLITFWLIFVL